MVEFARWEMRRQLAELWREAFGDPPRVPRYFLNNCFSPRDCLVYRVGDEIAAAVYLLPASVLSGGTALRAHYIFAAATRPRFRSRGYMSSLMAYAAIAGADRGDRFSAVLPADEGLYRFYGKLGYTPFFQARFLTVSSARLFALAKPGAAGTVLPDFRRLSALRNACLAGCDGSVLWDGRMLRFAAGMNTVYGDRLVCAVCGGKPAYALCRTEENVCTVLEAMAPAGAFPALAHAVLLRAPAEEYRFRLPVLRGPFAGEGETRPFGMVKPIGGTLAEDLSPRGPYLGMTMD